MRKYFPNDTWFRCETCDHIFAVRNPAEAAMAAEENLGLEGSLGRRISWDD